MSYTRITPYNDHDDATLTASATPATGFPVTNTQNTRRYKTWRSSGTGGVSITGVLSASRTANCFYMFRHTAAGGSVRLQLYSDAGASAQVYDSTALASTWWTDSDGYTWSTGTNDPFVSDAPYRHYFAATVYRSYKVTFSGTPSYYSYWQVSRIVLGRYLELQSQPTFGMSLGLGELTDKGRSDGGSLITSASETWRVLTMDLGRVRDDERATWLKIMKQNGTGRDFVLSIYPGENGDLERDHTINCKFVALDPIVRAMSVYTKRVQIEET